MDQDELFSHGLISNMIMIKWQGTIEK